MFIQRKIIETAHEKLHRLYYILYLITYIVLFQNYARKSERSKTKKCTNKSDTFLKFCSSSSTEQQTLERINATIVKFYNKYLKKEKAEKEDRNSEEENF